jgi:hypothetical protein
LVLGFVSGEGGMTPARQDGTAYVSETLGGRVLRLAKSASGLTE